MTKNLNNIHNIKRITLIFSCAFYVILFFLSRAWFFIDYPMPFLDGDTLDYLAIVESILNNTFPVLAARSPGFPLFIFFIYSLGGNLLHVIIVQNIISCFSGVIMIIAIGKTKWWSAFFVMIGLLGWAIKSSGALLSDLRLMADSLYTSFLILSFALFLLIFSINKAKRVVYILFCSISWACLVLIKPNAVATIPSIVFMVISYKCVLNIQSKQIIMFVMPMLIAMMSLTVYNGIKSDYWGLSYVPSSNIHVSTAYIWETDPSYSDDLNNKINKIIKERDYMLTPHIKQFLMESDIDAFEWVTTVTAVPLQYSVIRAFTPDSDYTIINTRQKAHDLWIETYSQQRITDEIKKVVFDTIKKTPSYYLKWLRIYLRRVALNTFQNDEVALRFLQSFAYEHYFGTPPFSFADLPLSNLWIQQYMKSVNLSQLAFKNNNFFIVQPDTRLMSLSFAISPPPQDRLGFISRTKLIETYVFIEQMQRRIFDNKNWWFVYFATFVFAVVNLLISRLKSYTSWFVLLCGFIFASTSVLFTAIWPPIPRLIYPVEWSIYLTISLSLQVIVEFFSLVYPKLSYRS